MSETDVRDLGNEWRDLMKRDRGIRKTIENLRDAFLFVLAGSDLKTSQVHQASITNVGLKEWPDEVHADILRENLLTFRGEEKYPKLLQQVAWHQGVYNPRLSNDRADYLGYTQRQMLRALLAEIGLSTTHPQD